MIRVYCFLIFLISSNYVFGQSEADMIRYLSPVKGSGAQSVGMAYSNTLLATDNSALFGNPAAIGLIKKSIVSVNLNYNGGAVKSNYLGSSIDQDFSNTKINQFSISYPYPVSQGSLVLAFGYSQFDNFDQTVKGGGYNVASSYLEGINGYDPSIYIRGSDFYADMENRGGEYFYQAYMANFYNPVQSSKDPNLYRMRSLAFGESQQDYSSISEGGMNSWSIAVSSEIAKGFLLGANIHFINGDYYNRFKFVETGNRNYYQSVPDSGYTTTTGKRRIFGSFNLSDILEEKITGYSVKLGGIINATEEIKVGLAYSLPTTLNIHTKSSVLISGEIIDADTKVPFTTGLLYPTEFSGDYEITSSSVFEANVAFAGFPFSTEIGLITQDWPNTRIKNDENDSYYDEINDFFRFGTKRTYDVKAGFQYAVPFLQSFIRVGLYSQDSPYKKGGERVNRYSTGFQFVSVDGYSIDLGYQFVNSSETYKAYSPLYKPKVTYTEDQTYSTVSVAFTMKL